MKKIMIMLGAIAMAACVQAASVSWASSKMYTPDADGVFTTTAAKATVNAYLFIVDAETYNNTSVDKIWDTYGTKLDSATKSGKTASLSSAVSLSDGVSYNVGDSVYAIVVYTTTANGQDWYIANKATTTLAAAADVTVAGLGTNVGGTGGAAITGWTAAVPEPTSGLLMLVGLGALALRRRRA